MKKCKGPISLLLVLLTNHSVHSTELEPKVIGTLTAQLPDEKINVYHHVRNIQAWDLSYLSDGIIPNSDSDAKFSPAFTACMKLSFKVDQEKARALHQATIEKHLEMHEKQRMEQGITIPNYVSQLKQEASQLKKFKYKIKCIHPKTELYELEHITNTSMHTLKKEIRELNQTFSTAKPK